MKLPSNGELERWKRCFSGESYFYGAEPGPVARRAVRYHRPSIPVGCPGGKPSLATALDAGCGEGQDLAFLAECGYTATGIDFTEEGIAKARRLLESRRLQAECRVVDLRSWQPEQHFDLVICVNVLQFLGSEATAALGRVALSVAPGGVLGLSMFAPEGKQSGVYEGIFLMTLNDLIATLNPDPMRPDWQMLETAQLWQWNEKSNVPQPFATLVARRIS